MRNILILGLFSLATHSFAQTTLAKVFDRGQRKAVSGHVSERPTVADMRERRRGEYRRDEFASDQVFGIGLVAAGVYGLFGVELDFKIKENASVGFGLGTGMSYDTWGLYYRHRLYRGQKIDTFFQAGFATWQASRASSRGRTPKPSYLAKKFLTDDDGNFESGEQAYIVYPAFGAIYQFDSGPAIFAAVQYLMRADEFRAALYGMLGTTFYF